jgi:uncharacterized protein (TIGR02145 family)
MLLVWLSSCEKPTDPDYSSKYDDKSAAFVPTTSLTTYVAADVAATSAWSGGAFGNTYGPNIVSKGVCWSTSSGPTLQSNCSIDGKGHTPFSSKLTPLVQGTRYFFRAYAVHESGTVVYGNERQLTTIAPPVVNTSSASGITLTSASLGGNVTADGGAAVTARGVCWSTEPNPPTLNTCIASGSGLGNFTANLSGLSPGTAYHAWAYAINAAGTSYGARVSFATSTPIPPGVTTVQATNIETTTATVGGNVTSTGTTAVTVRGVCWSTEPNPLTLNPCVSSGSGLGSFTYNLSGLTPSTTYYVWAYAINSVGTAYGDRVSFTTSSLSPPIVTTSQVTSIGPTTATAGGNVTSQGSTTVTVRGVCWSTQPEPATLNTCTASGSGTGSFTSNLVGLLLNTTYYVWAYASNSAGTSYGARVSFTTQNQTIPSVTTTTITNVAATTATVSGNVTSDGASTVTGRGVCYATTQNPTTSNQCIASGNGNGSFSANLTNLSSVTTYYVRTYATNAVGTAYGNQLSFTTQSLALASLTTSSVTNITANVATAGGNVTSSGSSTVTTRGVCYATTQNPTTSNQCVASGSGTGSFFVSLTGLVSGTTYYVRAYAMNVAGTAYGAQVSFSTLTPPTVSTATIANVAAITATAGGSVTSSGSSSVTARGVCYATTQNPTTANQCVTSGSGTGSFTVNLTSLNASTLYYVRAYATNSAGTSYGNQVTFTTLTLPIVSTASISNVTSISATANGNVTSAGSLSVTARGVCYSTNQNPTTSNQCVASGSGIGSFSANISGLSANTLYYVRAYAANLLGTTYGNQLSFTTLASVAPSVATSSISNIGSTTATASGNVTNSGSSAVTARGVCYSTLANPSLLNSCVSAGSGAGSFMVNLTGLSSNVFYYLRAYATNSAGTSYGLNMTFTTSFGDRDGGTVVVDITNPKTGRIWMDRNLGASRAATSSTDTQAYGDLYQWGRRADGHQKRTSGITNTLSTTSQPSHGNFIIVSSGPFDWRNPQSNNLWQGVSGVNNPCPVGYRLPTETEWNAEMQSWNSMNVNGAFASPLKLTLSGGRNINGTIYDLGIAGGYSSSTPSILDTGVRYLRFDSNSATLNFTSLPRAHGISVRCIKN